MGDITLATKGGLITHTIKAKQETYYLVTKDNLNVLKLKSALSDLFGLFASIAGGAYISTIITIKSIPNDAVGMESIYTLKSVFAISTIIFTILFICLTILFYKQIDTFKNEKIELEGNHPPEEEPTKSVARWG